MSDRLKSIIERIIEKETEESVASITENRGRHAFVAVSNMLRYIDENHDVENAEKLKKRFFNAARSGDFSKFRRGCRKLKETDERSTVEDN